MKYISVPEAAKITGYTRQHIYLLARSGKIEGAKKELDRVVLVPEEWANRVRMDRSMPKPKNWVTIADYAKKASMSRQAVYKRIKEGKVTAEKITIGDRTQLMIKV